MPITDEIVLPAQILSQGIGFGKPIFLNSQNIFEENTYLKKDIDQEILKFKKAIKKSKKEILEIKKSFANDELKITFDILNTHLEILSDPVILSEVVNRIKKENKSIHKILKNLLDEYKNKIKDPFFKEKVTDISDVFKRVLKNIKPSNTDFLKRVEKKSIIISDEIIPSDIFDRDSSKISAFISVMTSYGSHAAIIARSKNIPFVSNIDIEKIKNINMQDMIVDAEKGKVIINPTKKTYEKYKRAPALIESSQTKEKIKLQKDVNIFVNISSLKELDDINDKKISGIGLLRTELLFFKKQIPSQKEQLDVYTKIAKKLKNRPFVIRLFDLGADKNFYNIIQSNKTCFFSTRGAALLLKNQKILKDQVIAILKASLFGNIYLLIPFVKDIDEIIEIKKIIKSLQEDLKIPTSTIKIGSMIETPVAALMVDEIVKEVDFLSIGTNDLSRYTFASNKISLKEFHPALQKLFVMILKAANDSKKPTFLCGEMIADKKIMEKLYSLGMKNFSVSLKNAQLF
ncbi:MAG TPA: phosphoenolpyruvate--protein phosphotransferase [Chlamydiae bacterium]|nr:Phosphoenolpyruvate-protein phosphotransferase [Candidatus Anoxychlamydiales bacterium]HEU64290.1 phosphoenolpyruvate--protein phosphotransferase [Chlamydiota bacterium]